WSEAQRSGTPGMSSLRIIKPAEAGDRFGVRRQSVASTALWILYRVDIQSVVAPDKSGLPPHSKSVAHSAGSGNPRCPILGLDTPGFMLSRAPRAATRELTTTSLLSFFPPDRDAPVAPRQADSDGESAVS